MKGSRGGRGESTEVWTPGWQEDNQMGAGTGNHQRVLDRSKSDCNEPQRQKDCVGGSVLTSWVVKMGNSDDRESN